MKPDVRQSRFTAQQCVKALSALALLVTSSIALSEPFVVEDMPPDMDGVAHPWADARKPVAADFNGDGQPSWYAGGNRVAHPKEPTPLDPIRFSTSALPAISLSICPACTPRYLAFVVADVNRDGNQDIVRLNDWPGQSQTYTLQVFRGNGSNGFVLADRRDWTTNLNGDSGGIFVEMRADDYDRDGDLDLAILNTYEFTENVSSHIERGNLRIRWNNNASFDTETVLQANHFARQARLFSGDFDRDGDVDLMVNMQQTWLEDPLSSFPTTRLFTNQGAGTFTATSDASFNGADAMEADGKLIADVTQNSWPEWFAVDNNVIYRRDYVPGQGWAGAWSTYCGNSIYTHTGEKGLLVAADFNEDGRPDLVNARGVNASDMELVLFTTNTSNTCGSTEVLATLPSAIVAIGIGDARGDADQDMLVRLYNGSFRYIRNTAQRLHLASSNVANLVPMAGLNRIESADGNRDGIPDIYAMQVDSGNSRMQQFLGSAASPRYSSSEFKILLDTPSDFVVRDFNQDARVDFAYVVPNAGHVRVVEQINNSFFFWTDTKIADYAGASLIESGEVSTYDGRPDLFVASNANGGLQAFRSGPSGWTASTPRASGPVPDAMVVLPRYIGIADSVASCDSDGSTIQIQGYSTLLGWSQSAQLTQVLTGANSGICAVANMDEDAAPEVIFKAGNGALAYWSPTDQPASPYVIIDDFISQIVDIETLDANRDGLQDVLVATVSGLFILQREGIADTWTRYQVTPNAIRDSTIADIDREGYPEIMFVSADGLGIAAMNTTVCRIGSTTNPNGSPTTIAPGGAQVAVEVALENPGRLNEDAAIAVTSANVLFRHVVAGNPGAAMTPAEVEQAVASVTVLMDGLVIGSTATTLVDSGGHLLINYSPALGNAVPVPAAASKPVSFRVTLKPSAATASYSEFAIDVEAIRAAVIHPDGPSGRSSNMSVTPGIGRIRISSDLFANGFE